jgi:hypothetical protein
LDIAVGSGSLEMIRCLLDFRHPKPTRETLKQSISMGRFELIKLLRERLPETEVQDRIDLVQVAAASHQPEVLGWLFRDATIRG